MSLSLFSLSKARRPASLMAPRMASLMASIVAAALLTGCMKWDYSAPEDFTASGEGLFIVCEGNFQYGNASLSYYDPAERTVANEVFLRANGFKLGDVAQSMTIHDGLGWIVVNNSHVIFAIDPSTFREAGRIEGLTSPRYIHFINPTKAYVTQMWDNRIFIINPARYEVTGHITVPGMSPESGSTEQMVQWGGNVYVSCWSYQDRIIRIDPVTDEVTASLTVGLQPGPLAVDAHGKLWTVADGGYAGSPAGFADAALVKIDAGAFTVEQQWSFGPDATPSEMQVSADGTRLYWLNGDLWCMDVTAATLPAEPLVRHGNSLFYGLTVDPRNGELYVADAADYQQPGTILRFSAAGEIIDKFTVGVIPGAFCWKLQ